MFAYSPLNKIIANLFPRYKISRIKLLLSITANCFILACNYEKPNKSVHVKRAPIINHTFIRSYPHDTSSFTEGLVMFRNKLYESTGGTTDLPQTKSLFGILDLSIGKIKPKVELNKVSYFGEGITFCNGKVFQLTYKNRLCFAYDAFTFKKTNEYTLPTQEGWGITTDGTYLIMSDGTHNLTYINPIDFSVVKTLCVIENNTLVEQLNELEFINGFVYANIWLTNKIVKIDTTSGEIVGYLDLTSLAYDAKNIYPGAMEMNGIAFDSSKSSLYVTGKMWPKLYELSFNCR